MSALGSLALVVRATPQRVAHVDLLDHQDLVFEIDIAFTLCSQPALARVDPARFQRATQGSGESTGSCGHDVVEGRGVVGILARRGAVVLPDHAMRAERDGLRLDR